MSAEGTETPLPRCRAGLPRPARAPARARDLHGRYVSGAAMSAALPSLDQRRSCRHPLRTRSARQSQPYYMRVRSPVASMRGLAKLWQVCSEPGVTGEHTAWTPPTLAVSVEEQRGAVRRLLDHLGLVLRSEGTGDVVFPAAAEAGPPNLVFLPGSEAFARPPGYTPDLRGCMLPEQAATACTPYVFRDANGYLMVTIGRAADGRFIRERAHRIVLWAMHGPPPPSLRDPVCMHLCCHRTFKCLNAEHMVWGERLANAGEGKKDSPVAVAEARLRCRREQRGASMTPAMKRPAMKRPRRGANPV